MRYLLFSAIMILGSHLSAQNWLEDFETEDLISWDELIGIADLVSEPTVNGNKSLRLWNFAAVETPIATLIHKTFQRDFGTYSFYAMGEGPTSDADFYFQYQDSINYYQVSHNAEGTDNPEFVVSKVIDGTYTELYKGDAVEERGEWVYIAVERYCNGRMVVSYNNNDVLDIFETDILVAGTIGLGSWGLYTFFDRVEFQPYQPIYQVNETICLGSSFKVGPKSYSEPGSYRDTLKNMDGCDSIVKLELSIVDSIKISLDTVFCHGDFIMIGDQMINAMGEYQIDLKSSQGCDSIVTWTVTESPEFDLGPDRAICDNESLTISAGPQSSYAWSNGSTFSELTIDQVGTYNIEVLDLNNCIQLDTIEIVKQCELKMFSANIFTPDQDQVNDTWRPEFDLLPIDYSLNIFDKWGNVIFQTNDPTRSWDGKFNNKDVMTGIYIFQVTADSQKFNGDILVVR